MASISTLAHTTTFTYGPERKRFKRTDNAGSGVKTTLTIGSVEKIIEPNNSYVFKRYLGGIVIHTQGYTSTHTPITARDDLNYVFRDHLGSVDVITGFDGLGAVVISQEQSFDAWGQRRNASNWTGLSSSQLMSFDHTFTTRGFTGHEMLDEVGIIHMNGRIYDPKLGRFLQADPFVQDLTDTQMFNRYTYVRNNPLNATDPSGYFLTVIAGLALFAKGVTDIVIIVAVIGAASFADALIQGASIGDALLAGISGAALSFATVGTFPTGGFGLNVDTFINVVTVAVVGGITTSLRGGRFGHGFKIVGISAALGGAVGSYSELGKRLGRHGRVIAKTVVGGTLSEITGGKFANGAATAAFAAIVSSVASKASKPPVPVGEEVGEVYGHGVWGVGKHGSVRFYPDDPNAINAYLKENGFLQVLQVDEAGGQYIVFSGGADFEDSGLLGNLRGDINRSSDLATAPNDLVGSVYAPVGVGKDAFIKQLITNTSTYNGNPVNYDLLPSLSSEYNSNSYFRGLVNSAGGTIQGNINWQYQGFSKPVPRKRF